MATTKSGGHSKDSDASKKSGAKSSGKSEKSTGASNPAAEARANKR